MTTDRQSAAGLLDRLQELIAARDLLRGQVLTFGINENLGNQMVSFLPRPAVSASDVILPPDVLPTIEKHVSGPAEHAAQLRKWGIHLKRGVLLHGPPGTGKTHTVRYLMGAMSGSTVVVLSGSSLMFIEQAAALARKLAPSLVIVEDVDLIAQDRSMSPGGNPLLFSLLDAMDGVASDADVTFVLTTNRVGVLEAALAQRPGRIDLAVEIPRPDADGRRSLVAEDAAGDVADGRRVGHARGEIPGGRLKAIPHAGFVEAVDRLGEQTGGEEDHHRTGPGEEHAQIQVHTPSVEHQAERDGYERPRQSSDTGLGTSLRKGSQ
jgi:energy-coupling factor transporter ATP-binding protein EcfA2